MSNKAKEALTKESQAETDKSFNCFECNFVGSSNIELKWHMSENHGWPKFVDIDEKNDEDNIDRDNDLICRKCQYQAEDIYDYDGHIAWRLDGARIHPQWA